MSEIRVLARIEEREGDLWHWVVMHDAIEPLPEVYRVFGGVDTICGIAIATWPVVADLSKEAQQRPDEPDCAGCRHMGLGPVVFAQIASILEAPELVPVGVAPLSHPCCRCVLAIGRVGP